MDCGILLSHHFLCHRQEAFPISFPGMRLGFAPGGVFHRHESLPVRVQQFDLLRDRFSGANWDDEAISFIVDNVWPAGVLGGDNKRPLCHRFEHHQTESLEERWENEQIVFVHFTQHAGVVQRWYPAMFARGRFQRATVVCGFAAEQRQLDRGFSERDRFE